ncbi:hypothetical protein Q8A67_002914 [Cirrhinus molitorella]|uniref:Uncharacterized protein n=1 Tax=Cirrhinus molitorella TaxID=172907 RepID=A0AA88QCG0_9TELE|nr:hypothetical protein Q8A67_002914 [Cirrhinus molitorella]
MNAREPEFRVSARSRADFASDSISLRASSPRQRGRFCQACGCVFSSAAQVRTGVGRVGTRDRRRRSGRLAGVSPLTRSRCGGHSRRCADAAAGLKRSSVRNLSRRSHRT